MPHGPDSESVVASRNSESGEKILWFLLDHSVETGTSGNSARPRRVGTRVPSLEDHRSRNSSVGFRLYPGA
eukprot:1984097-Rhodomonas_salina.1